MASDDTFTELKDPGLKEPNADPQQKQQPWACYCNNEKGAQLLKGLKELKEAGKYCDVVIQVSGEEFHAHSCVLAVNSPVLHAQMGGVFPAKMSDEKGGRFSLKLPTENPEVARSLVEYMYSGEIAVSMETVVETIRVAGELEMPDIVPLCERHITENLLNWNSMRQVAFENRVDVAIVCVRRLLLEHTKNIIASSKFLYLSSADVTELLEDCNTEMDPQTEEKILEIVLTWVCHNYEERKDVFPRLLKLVRPQLFSRASVAAVFSHAKFQDSNICSHEASLDFINQVSVQNSTDLKDVEETSKDTDPEEDNAKSGKKNRKCSTKRKQKTPEVKTANQRERRRASRTNPPRDGVTGPDKDGAWGKRRRNAGIKAGTKKMDNNAQNETEKVKKPSAVFNDWSITTADMDIEIDQKEGDGVKTEVLSSLSVGKKSKYRMSCRRGSGTVPEIAFTWNSFSAQFQVLSDELPSDLIHTGRAPAMRAN